MCAFDDSLTEIDWLNSLSIQKKVESKDGNTLPVSISENLFVTPRNSPSDTYIVSRCNGYDKPSYSYAYLIKLAISSSKDKKMKLNEIYSWITETFPYYKYMQIDNNKGWKNAIRHNLSLNKIFKRCAKDATHLGKGSYWMIDSDFDDEVQYPPVKKMKFCYNITNSLRSNSSYENIRSNISISKKSDNFEENSSKIPVICTLLPPGNKNETLILKPIVNKVSVMNAHNYENLSVEGPIIFSDIKSNADNISEANVYYNDIAVINSRAEICQMSESQCEISYSNNPMYSERSFSSEEPKTNINLKSNSEICSDENCLLRNKLEVDEDVSNESAKNDFILKTPVLSQINSIPMDISGSNIESKYVFGGNIMDKNSIANNSYAIFSQDSFDNLSFYDESIQHSFSESESRSFELSHSTRKYLYNLSGVKETLFNRSQWLILEDSDDMLTDQCTYDVLYDIQRCENSQSTGKKSNIPDNEISASKDYLELKSSLNNYIYKSAVSSSTQFSVSTSSTEKSTNTLRSKSDVHKESESCDSESEFSNQNLNVMENCDAEEEINDIFPWDSLI